MGKYYLIGADKEHVVKLDIYYANDPFFQEPVTDDGIRLATIEEIIAMKVDIIQRTARKKDFWDIHELLPKYSITQMIELHKRRCEWAHGPVLIFQNFTAFDEADDELDPICLRGKEWLFIREDFEDAVRPR